jgi:hypothetical protein
LTSGSSSATSSRTSFSAAPGSSMPPCAAAGSLESSAAVVRWEAPHGWPSGAGLAATRRAHLHRCFPRTAASWSPRSGAFSGRRRQHRPSISPPALRARGELPRPFQLLEPARPRQASPMRQRAPCARPRPTAPWSHGSVPSEGPNCGSSRPDQRPRDRRDPNDRNQVGSDESSGWGGFRFAAGLDARAERKCAKAGRRGPAGCALESADRNQVGSDESSGWGGFRFAAGLDARAERKCAKAGRRGPAGCALESADRNQVGSDESSGWGGFRFRGGRARFR